MFSLESYTICKKKGIPAILATFDHRRSYPNIGGDLRRLKVPGIKHLPQEHPYNFEDLSQVFDEARANHKFVIIDVTTGFGPNHPMFYVLRNSNIFEATSIAALVPIVAEDYGTCGAEMALRAFTNFGMHCDRGLIRRFSHPGEPTSTNLSRLPAYPVWRTKYMSRATMELINQEIERVCNPTLNHLPRLHELKHSQLLTKSKSEPIAEAIEHFDLAKKTIYQAILAPITNMIP
jgi:hypothetical protein